jgi:hypothetical protein
MRLLTQLTQPEIDLARRRRDGRACHAAGCRGGFLIFLIALILLSSGFLITESDHDCPGEGCHVCEQLALCEAVLEYVAFAVALFFAAAASRRVFLRTAAASYPAAPAFRRRVPLFSDSVRLNL